MATLKEAIKAVLPHASKDRTLSILCAVKITGDEVWATDRHTLARGVYVLPKAGDSDPTYPDEFLLDAKDAAEVVKHKSEVFSITRDTGSKVTFNMQNGSTMMFDTIEGDYPSIGRLIPDGEPVEIGRVGLLSTHLDRFSSKHFPRHAFPRHAPHRRSSVALRFQFYGETKPAKVTISEAPWYMGLIMPLRSHD